MKLIHQSHEILHLDADPLKLIEVAGRTCYKSESKICEGSDVKFTAMLLGRHHESVIEHSLLTVRFITNRGVTHEDVRHRISSYSQESTRYCNYGGKDMQFIIPVWTEEAALLVAQENIMKENRYIRQATDMLLRSENPIDVFVASCILAEFSYRRLLGLKWTPQQAREVLPNALKTEIVHSANFRAWRHILKERTSTAAHPQMRALMLPLLAELKTRVPVIFDDINP